MHKMMSLLQCVEPFPTNKILKSNRFVVTE